MKHALLILCHKDLRQVEKLIEFFDDDFVFYVHIDKHANIDNIEIEHLRKKRPNINVYRKYKVTWGGINILRAELYLLRRIVANEDVDYIHLCSGQDYPIKKLEDIKKFYERNSGYQFIEYNQLPYSEWNDGTYWRFEKFQLFDFLDWYNLQHRRIIDTVNRWQCKFGIKRAIPDQYPKLYGGSNWMSITKNCAQYVSELKGIKKKFFNRLRFTFAPDEVYFQTVIINSEFSRKVENDNKRLILWGPRMRSPKVLTDSNWWEIAISDKLWARKLDFTQSRGIYNLLDKYVFLTDDVDIQTNGSWKHNSFQGHVFDNGLAHGIVHILPYLKIKTAIDFGCGPGWYVKLFHNYGIDMQGYDGNPMVEDMSSHFFNNGFYCQCVDLNEKVEAEEQVDLVLCLEVGEHIPAKYEKIFIGNLTRNSSHYILLSWAVPGQNGDGHINCRNNGYIIERLKLDGFYLNVPITNLLRTNASCTWFKNTIMFFEKNQNVV